MPEQVKLQKHQQSAINQLDKSRSLIAYHGLGSGKTLTAIEAGEKTPGSKLVLTPASLQHNFRKELHKFNVSDKDYHVVSYETFRRNPDRFINKYKPKMIIADEFHRTKDPDTMLSESIRQIRPQVKKFMGLTGSLAQNHPTEIAELVNTAVGKPVLGNDKQFRQHFIHERKVSPGLIGHILGRKPGVVEEPKHLDDFKKITSKYVNTFKGDEEYKKHIPSVEKSIKRVEMSKEQNKIYDYTFDKVPAWVRWKIKHNLPTSKAESRNINAFLIGARQASNSTEGFGNPHQTPKIQALMHDILHESKRDPNFKSVVYSNFLDSGISPVAKAMKQAKIPYGEFTGEQKDSERHQMVHDYNKGKLKALLLSPAGGEGLDLKGTKFMGVLESNWNPEKINQAIGRTARFKSHESLPEAERKVKVVQYLSSPRLGLLGRIKRHFKPETHSIGVDEYIYNRAKEKENLNKQFTDMLTD